jgi:hypothetical protein
MKRRKGEVFMEISDLSLSQNFSNQVSSMNNQANPQVAVKEIDVALEDQEKIAESTVQTVESYDQNGHTSSGTASSIDLRM